MNNKIFKILIQEEVKRFFELKKINKKFQKEAVDLNDPNQNPIGGLPPPPANNAAPSITPTPTTPGMAPAAPEQPDMNAGLPPAEDTSLSSSFGDEDPMGGDSSGEDDENKSSKDKILDKAKEMSDKNQDVSTILKVVKAEIQKNYSSFDAAKEVVQALQTDKNNKLKDTSTRLNQFIQAGQMRKPK